MVKYKIDQNKVFFMSPPSIHHYVALRASGVERIKFDRKLHVAFLPLILSVLRSFMLRRMYRRIVQLLPMEYAVEINRLIAMEMEDSIG